MNGKTDRASDGESLEPGDRYRDLILHPSENPTLFRLGRLYVALPLAVLPLALVWPFLPDLFFELSIPVEIDRYMRSISAKWRFESSFFEGVKHTWGIRYTTLTAMCITIATVTQVTLLIPTMVLVWKFGTRPLTSEGKKMLWIAPLALLLVLGGMLSIKLGDFHYIGGRRSSKLDRMTDTWIIFPFIATGWAFSSGALAMMVISYTKMLRHQFRPSRTRDPLPFAHHNQRRD